MSNENLRCPVCGNEAMFHHIAGKRISLACSDRTQTHVVCLYGDDHEEMRKRWMKTFSRKEKK
ncbi:MAG: hypothetical protein IJD43_05005 [Thermoguttaceae bacterium]|nr:hypothetical protein [Thermoguttaceae bacterium]